MKQIEESVVLANGTVRVRRFIDMDGGCHFKWIFFSMDGKEYPVGSFDILRKHEIDWENTKEVAA